MKTLSIKAFTFNELPKEAQERALKITGERLSDQYLDGYEYQAKEESQETLESLGFEGVKIYLSGFSSQGDGACFICDSCDLEKLINTLFPKYKRLIPFCKEGIITCKIEHNHRYYHERSTDISLDFYCGGKEYPNVEILWELFYDDFKNWYYDFCKDIYRNCEKEHDFIYSESFQKELIVNREDEILFDTFGNEIETWKFEEDEIEII